MLPPMLIELLLGLAREGALGARVWPLPAVVHLVLLQLPLCAEHLLADAALLRVLGVVDLEVEAEGAQLLEALVALGALKHAVERRVDLQRKKLTFKWNWEGKQVNVFCECFFFTFLASFAATSFFPRLSSSFVRS